MKILIVADVSNLYYCLKKQFPNSRLNYGKFLANCKEYGELYRALAYGAQINDGAESFISYLGHSGWEPNFKQAKVFVDVAGREVRKADWDVGITIDVVRMLPLVDTVILGSADSDFKPLVEFIQQHGKRCFVYACRISRDLREAADAFREITVDDLETRPHEEFSPAPSASDSRAAGPEEV